MLDWSKLPDLMAVGLLACAFSSVARRNQVQVSGLWLTGWLMIVLHFIAFMFLPAPGLWGTLAMLAGLAALVWAGILFMWAAVPYRQELSSRWMMAALVASNTLYLALILISAPLWALNLAAFLLGAYPLAVALLSLRTFNHTLRWYVVGLYCSLSIFLLIFQNRPGNGADLALNAVLFSVYFGCCIHFIYMYRRATAGAFITIAGFFAWAMVFVVSPLLTVYQPVLHVESEVWNLPKYLVAVGMILLALEDQIEHNKHLALHDALTGLPNRRLFQDRLTGALERARRTGTHAALLVIDLDQFKQVNDTLGHHVGDMLLQRVGATFLGRVRRSDTVARTGGDEFSVVLEERTSREDAERVGACLMQLLDEPMQLGEHRVRVGASIGIAIYPDDATTIESLCIAADLRMYEVKRGAESFSCRASLPVAAVPPKPPSGEPGPKLRTVYEMGRS